MVSSGDLRKNCMKDMKDRTTLSQLFYGYTKKTPMVKACSCLYISCISHMEENMKELTKIVILGIVLMSITSCGMIGFFYDDYDYDYDDDDYSWHGDLEYDIEYWLYENSNYEYQILEHTQDSIVTEQDPVSYSPVSVTFNFTNKSGYELEECNVYFKVTAMDNTVFTDHVTLTDIPDNAITTGRAHIDTLGKQARIVEFHKVTSPTINLNPSGVGYFIRNWSSSEKNGHEVEFKIRYADATEGTVYNYSYEIIPADDLKSFSFSLDSNKRAVSIQATSLIYY
jgi:hypothetical protein